MTKTNKDIIATFLNLFWRLISSPLILLLIPLYLTEFQQGYWYLFTSLAALNTFADLGFSNIILQFSAHEYAFLETDKDRFLVGPEENIKKLGSFFRFVIKWLSLMCAIVYPVIFFVGICFFVRDGVLGKCLLPWFVFSFGSLIEFINNSVLSFLEGLNQIDRIQRSRMFVSIINTVIIVLGLLLGINIYALAFGMFISSCFMFITIFYTFGKVIRQIFQASVSYSYPWRKDILPLFKKYVLSFASGYFLFQIYTPLMHYFHGPVWSGKVGISISLVMAIFTFSNIWIYTIIPRINILIEKKEWSELDSIFKKRFALSMSSYLFIFICYLLFMGIFTHSGIKFIDTVLSRFLPEKAMSLLIISYFFQLAVNAWAVYLRGHKQEPFWWTGIVSAVWVFSLTVLAGKLFSVDLFFIGLLSNYTWGVPLCYSIYRNCKKNWHV